MTTESSGWLTTVYPAVDELTLTQLYCNYTSWDEEFSSNESQLFCTVNWDGVSCWPPTLAGSTATVPCFSELNGVKYDISIDIHRTKRINEKKTAVVSQEIGRILNKGGWGIFERRVQFLKGSSVPFEIRNKEVMCRGQDANPFRRK
ncbi:g_PROTEIN_RECEP_F2_3 domain-containing protein [Caerostris darwini]|uniref:G_PROTEIN_RECEP_F2_3 domain-containing protein n=1 Tax=Caerostris darwini TaxID=1538125 RepID=A0AAV4SWM7_9ARAC|nr:g_PROTEIN_RECEP_F2_3 domain-containing protein [Caerostris darwini]